MKRTHATSRATARPIAASAAIALFVLAMMAAPAAGQSTVPVIFVANNGNLEGSVSSLTVAPDGSLGFRQRIVLGSVPSTQFHHPGLNASSISISPNGRWLAVGHTTASTTVEQISIIEVLPDAGIELAFTFTTPDSPLDVEWVTDALLAATRTSTGGTSEVRLYEVDPEIGRAVPTGSAVSGGFNSWIAVHPSRELLFSQQTGGGNLIRTFAVASDGSLTQIAATPNGAVYPLGLGVSPDGTLLYSGGGISAGGHAVSGFTIDTESGALTPIPGSPWTSPGQSPKQVAVSGDQSFAYAAHGSDSTIRGFAIGAGGRVDRHRRLVRRGRAGIARRDRNRRTSALRDRS